MSPTVCSLVAVCVISCIIHLAPVMSQSTSSHCHDDGDRDLSVLTALVSHLQDYRDSLEQQETRFKDSLAQLQNRFKDSLAQQQKQLTKLEEFVKQHLQPTHDCGDLLRDGNNISGVYEVYLAKARKYVQVYCDMETDGGGWLVFQRRKDGSVDFYRDWTSYKEGFGEVTGEFWLGNDYLHDITSQACYTLRVDLGDFEDNTRYAVYSSFAITSECDKYRLSLGAYSGTAGDSLRHHAGKAFSTRDRDNDVYSGHCARQFQGSWWYGNCHDSNLNGRYFGGPYSSYADGIVWEEWRSNQYSLKTVEMKLRC